jgi:hypothetical protein
MSTPTIPSEHEALALPTFRLYRKQPPAAYREGGYANAPDEPQLEGVIFSDGTCAVRWLTDLRSMSYWPDFATFEKVHGHPEYESEIVWLSPPSP